MGHSDGCPVVYVTQTFIVSPFLHPHHTTLTNYTAHLELECEAQLGDPEVKLERIASEGREDVSSLPGVLVYV